MSFEDMIASTLRNQAHEIFKPDFSKCQYVTPCCSNIFDKQGSPIGYYIDQYGRKWHQDGSGMISEERTVPYVHIAKPVSAAEYMVHKYGEAIDVAYEEIKE